MKERGMTAQNSREMKGMTEENTPSDKDCNVKRAT